MLSVFGFSLACRFPRRRLSFARLVARLVLFAAKGDALLLFAGDTLLLFRFGFVFQHLAPSRFFGALFEFFLFEFGAF
jgi:hypothetical protein